MTEQERIKLAVEETVNEMNQKVNDLSKLKLENQEESEYSKKIDEIQNFLNENIIKMKDYYNQVKESSNVDEIIKEIHDKSKDIYNEIQFKIDNSKLYQDTTDAINNNQKIKNIIDVINENTDKVLYKVRDLYDEVSANESVKNAVSELKDVSGKVTDSVLRIIKEKISK